MKTLTGFVAVAALVALAGCNSDLSKNAAPVELVVTNSQTLHTIDLLGGTGCDQNIATVQLQAFTKNKNQISDQTFNQIRITRYRVSYVRIDGGKVVPAPFVRSIDNLLTPNGAASTVSNFQAFEADAINHAPFQALFPNNGGRDPETGRPVVSMDLVLEVFGETLAGERVSGSTRVPVDFIATGRGCF